MTKGIYIIPKWAVHQITRETGLLEDICEHGVGHPNLQWIREYKEREPERGKHIGIHGCDGCCYKGENAPKTK